MGFYLILTSICKNLLCFVPGVRICGGVQNKKIQGWESRSSPVRCARLQAGRGLKPCFCACFCAKGEWETGVSQPTFLCASGGGAERRSGKYRLHTTASPKDIIPLLVCGALSQSSEPSAALTPLWKNEELLMHPESRAPTFTSTRLQPNEPFDTHCFCCFIYITLHIFLCWRSQGHVIGS